MAVRQVTGTKTDADGDITHLCGATWGPETKVTVKSNINSGTYIYQVKTSKVVCVKSPTRTNGFYLRTEADGKETNNLAELSPCN